VLAACGSTVQVRSTTSTGQGALDGGLGGVSTPGLGQGGSGQLPGNGTSGGVVGAPGGGAAPGSGSGSTGQQGGTTGGVSTPQGPAVVGNVRGVTATTVRVGITYSSDIQKYATVLDPNAETVDTTAVAKVIVKHVNAEGGLLGRKLEPVFHDQKLADSIANQDGANEAVCATFTQDKPVAWGIINLANRVSYECMAKAQTPVWDVNTGDPVDQQWAKPFLPYFHAPVMPDSAVYLRTWVDRLAAQQYFTGWDPATQTASAASPVKVGVYYFDRATDKRIYETELKPALAAHGITVAADFGGDANPAVRANQEQSAILKFRQNGVTHLLVMGPIAFVGAGGQQGWHPRLGIGTHNQAQLADPALLKGVVAAGYSSPIDVGAKAPGVPTPANNACLGWVKKDLQYDMESPQSAAYLQAIALCDAILVPVEAFRAAGALGPAALQAGLEKTHGKTKTVHTFTQGFSATRWYGVDQLRDLEFRESCTCWRYTGVVTPL
jgi:hypothetical protein